MRWFELLLRRPGKLSVVSLLDAMYVPQVGKHAWWYEEKLEIIHVREVEYREFQELRRQEDARDKPWRDEVKSARKRRREQSQKQS